MILKTLFGTEDAEWGYSDEALEKALELKIFQEKTKQEYYRVEAINRSIELMKLVAVAKIPANLIPCVFGQPQQASMTPIEGPVLCAPSVPFTAPQSTPEPNAQHTPLQSPSSPSPRKSPHMRGRTISNMNELRETPFLRTERSSTASSMASFKFGAGSAEPPAANGTPQRRTTLAPKHQLSPSRIGAQAISSLSRDGAGIRKNMSIHRLRHGSNHQRTLSLPTSVSIPEAAPVEFHRSNQNSNGDIFIPDLTGKTPNAELGSQKKRRINSIQEFEFYKPTLSLERGTSPKKEKVGKTTSEEGDDDTIDEIIV